MSAAWNMAAVTAPPTNTLSIIFQLAMPVISNISAPIAMAITLVSPTEPGIKPKTMSDMPYPESIPFETSASGVACVKVSGSVFPKPKIVSRATQTLSPLISVG